jgi:hypothetical protein
MVSISPSSPGGVMPLAESFEKLYRRMAASFAVPALLLAGSLWATPPALAVDPTPTPKTPPTVHTVPPPGVAIADDERAELKGKIEALGEEIESLSNELKNKPAMLELLPDVQIFYKAADWAVRYNEFFNPKEVASAKKLLEMGMERAKELRAGKPSWNTATGLVPRGYLSKIDGSVQPYGMVIPEDWKPDETAPRRLDFWCHGRGETLSELSFISGRLTSKGEFTPPGALVLHLYGRYCCANKFAGERDLFEALENAKKHYKIDQNKLVIRGFSMGGGSTWQFGSHFGGYWAAVQPGAGFGETKEFMKLGTTPDKPLPPAWEQTLWQWYDSTGYVANLSNTTTVAYSGEIDGQRQAANIMVSYAEKEGVNIEQVIGPKTQHKILPESKPEIDALVTAGVEKHEAMPKKVWFVTYTLVYPRMDWVEITGMEKEWERAEVIAEIQGDKIVATTKNVSELHFAIPPAASGQSSIKTLVIDRQAIAAPARLTARKIDGKWSPEPPSKSKAISIKEPGMCGPIDHAFMSSFIFVHPTGKPLNDKVGEWTKAEFDHATGFWRKVFRGEAPVKEDSAITLQDITNSNLILWGDPSSNAVLAKILPKLPIQWTRDTLVFAGKTYDAAHVAPVMIFPNPLNPAHYVVINSGPTMREQALLNNADQTPKLPDWAIVDLNTPPDGKWPGQVLNAGFFDEHWVAPKK